MNENVKSMTLLKNKKQRQYPVFLFILAFLLLGQVVYAQSRIVTGTISGDGEALIGANVREKGTNNGTITDLDGKFSLSVNSGAVLEISYLGYETKTIHIKQQAQLNIELKADSKILEEVVVIGYGVQKKRLVTGATVQVKGEDITKLNTVSALGALQSQTPGVNITQQSGKPGDGFKVSIRGLGTIYNAEPLYVIDGVPGGDINMLNPSDIEAVDVLKDAATSAIYGARAANGVILVTTKQGKKGKVSAQYDGYVGWQNIARTVTPLNAQQYVDLIKESGKYTEANFQAEVPLWDKIQSGEWTGTNWLDEMTRKNAPIQNHAFNLTGGNEFSTFSIGFSYTSQEPIIGLKKNNDVKPNYERYTTRLNSEHTLVKAANFDLLQFGQTLTMGFANRSGLGMGTGNMYWNDVRNALVASPLFPAYKEDGDFEWPVLLDTDAVNPLAEMYYLRSMVNSKNYSARGSFYFILQPIKDLKFRSTFGYAFNGWSSREYKPAYQLNEKIYQNTDYVSQGSGNGLQWSWDNVLSYDFTLANSHKFNTMIGMALEKWGLGEDINGNNIDSEFNDFDHAYLSNTRTVASGSTNLTGAPWSEGSLVSFFGRVTYDYKGKYMATALFRSDASSNFARGNRWGHFPSFSVGWNIAEEAFMEPTRNILDLLKLRLSWGENGNNKIPSNRYLPLIALGDKYNAAWYYFGTDKGSPTIGSYPEFIANRDLKWETSRQLNIGLDTRLMNNKLGFTFDWYKKKTIDWLVQIPALGIWGTGGPYINGGDVENTGFEISADWNDQIGNFKYGIRGNVTHNKNKVLKIQNAEGLFEAGSGLLGHNTGNFIRAQEGYAIGYFYGYKTNGIFQNQAEIDAYVDPKTGQKILPDAKPGDVRFVDRNNNGAIDQDDRTKIGDPHPDFTYGLSLNLEWKGIDLSVTGYGTAGQQIAKSYRSYGNKVLDNYTTDDLARWHGEGTSNRLPSVGGSSINWQYVSDLYIEDADFFRITNLTLGYDFKRVFRKLPLSQLRIYGTVQNLVTITGYSGMDPEVGYGGDTSWATGVDLGFYPGARTYMVGVNIRY